jgi:GntR family transcriptional regulator
MHIDWNDKDPIYRQLRDRIVELALEGIFPDGAALPSIREISAQHRINHLTVAKAMQLLVDEGLVEKRRGLGMYVAAGANARLRRDEKKQFLDKEWPAIQQKIERLGLKPADLLEPIGTRAKEKP